MVVNIRGTSGSGKSTVVRALMETASFRPVYDGLFGLRRPEAYVGALPGVERGVCILGPYDIPTGGCDNIPTYDQVIELLERYAARGHHVVFEGLLISTCRGGVIGEALERRGRDAAILFLDTPVGTCIERVRARRRARGNTRAFDPTGLAEKHATIARLRERIGKREAVANTPAGAMTVLSVSDAAAVAVTGSGRKQKRRGPREWLVQRGPQEATKPALGEPADDEHSESCRSRKSAHAGLRTRVLRQGSVLGPAPARQVRHRALEGKRGPRLRRQLPRPI
jgi:hypothetical protein